MSVLLISFVLTAGMASLATENQSVETARTDSISNSPHVGINLEPIWLVLGGLGAKLDYFATDSVSVNLSGILLPERQVTPTSTTSTTSAVDTYKSSRYEVLLGSTIMLTGYHGTRGLYINPAIGYQSSKISDYSTFKLSGEHSSPMARLTVGYQWILAKHLRLAAGGGLSLNQASDISVKDNAGKEVLRQKSSSLGGLALDLQVGYVF